LNPDGVLGRSVLVLLVANLLLHILGASVLRDSFWGTHLYAFFPPWTLLIATAGLLLVVWLARAPGTWLVRTIAAAPDPESWPQRRRTLFLVAGSVLAGLVFWLARIRHTLLGDGNVIVMSVPAGEKFNVRQPLTAYLNHFLYRLVHARAPDGAEPAEVAMTSMAVGSVVAGMLLVPVVWGLATEIRRLGARPGAPQEGVQADGLLEDGPSDAGTLAPAWLLAAILQSQGYVLLVCGYVENYTYLLLALAAYMWLSLRFLAGRTGLLLPGIMSLLAVTLHLSAGIILPSLALLVGVGLARAPARARTVRDLVILAVVGAGMLAFLYVIGAKYSLLRTFIDVARDAVIGSAERSSAYSLSLVHLRDFVNEQLLIGPLAMWLSLPAIVVAARARAHRSAAGAYLLLLAVSYLGVSWAARDSNLGYARNWDLLAPGGMVFCAAALGLFLHAEPARPRAWILVWGLALSLYHTLPWIVLNTSETRSVARVMTLPLGLGRTELVVGNWYLRQGQRTQARAWLERSLAIYPDNVSACNLLGNVYVQDGEPERAAVLFANAVRLRPTSPEYRRKLVQVLLAVGRQADALPHFAFLAQRSELRPEDWTRYGGALRAVGRADEAQRVFKRALEANEQAWRARPNDSKVNLDMGRALTALGAYDRALVHFRRAVEVQPNSTSALFDLGGLLMQMERPGEARPYLEKILKLEPEHRESSRIVEWLQEIRERTGTPPE